jgi:hypothetical protein
VQIQVGGTDMRRDTRRNLRDEQCGHRTANDGEMPTAERASE